MLEHLGERAFVVAAVVLQPRDDVVAVLERWNDVASPDIHRIEANLVCETIHHALEHERRLGPSRTAIGFDRRRVRVNAIDIFLDGRNRVRSRQHQAVQDRRNAGRRG